MKQKFSFIDLEIENNEMTMTHKLLYTKESMERAIKGMRYHGRNKTKDQRVEFGNIPSIAKTFYQTLFFFGLPSAEELIHVYFKKHMSDETEDTIQFYGNKQYFSKEGVKARIFRAYPSLLRDFHFFLSCKENKAFDKVSYSFDRDMKGIDLLVEYKGQAFGIALFVNTPRSKSFKQKKYGRHQELTIPEICVTINPFDKSLYVGDYALYQQSHIEQMIAEMDDHLAKIAS